MPTLVIIPSFGTNEIILSGLIECLKHHFNVVFIDLPGTIPEIPPLDEISFENLTEYVSKKIEELQIEDYYLCGISFGFYIAGAIGKSKKCKGLIAVSPFLTTDSMNATALTKKICYFFGLLGSKTKFHKIVWQNRFMQMITDKATKFPEGVFREIVKTYDSKTFFECIRLIFGTSRKVELNDSLVALVINKHDSTIRYDYTVNQLKSNTKGFLEINTELEHFPHILTSNYFERIFNVENTMKILDFFNKV